MSQPIIPHEIIMSIFVRIQSHLFVLIKQYAHLIILETILPSDSVLQCKLRECRLQWSDAAGDYRCPRLEIHGATDISRHPGAGSGALSSQHPLDHGLLDEREPISQFLYCFFNAIDVKMSLIPYLLYTLNCSILSQCSLCVYV